MADLIANQPVVIDNGSGVLKAGFAGGEKPKIVFGSTVGRPKHERTMIGGALDSSDGSFVGRKVQEKHAS
jgi:centractin